MQGARQMGISQRWWWNRVEREHAWLEEEWLSAGGGVPADSTPGQRVTVVSLSASVHDKRCFPPFSLVQQQSCLLKSCWECIAMMDFTELFFKVEKHKMHSLGSNTSRMRDRCVSPNPAWNRKRKKKCLNEVRITEFLLSTLKDNFLPLC